MLWLCIIFMLLIKIHLLQKSAREIEKMIYNTVKN